MATTCLCRHVCVLLPICVQTRYHCPGVDVCVLLPICVQARCHCPSVDMCVYYCHCPSVDMCVYYCQSACKPDVTAPVLSYSHPDNPRVGAPLKIIDFHFPQSGSYRSGFAQISHQSRAGSRPRGERGEKSGKQPVWAFTGHPVIRLLICKHYHILHHPLVPASTHIHSSAIASKHAASRQECRQTRGFKSSVRTCREISSSLSSFKPQP